MTGQESKANMNMEIFPAPMQYFNALLAALGDLFASKAGKEKQARRQAEPVINPVSTEIAKLRNERDKLWNQAFAGALQGLNALDSAPPDTIEATWWRLLTCLHRAVQAESD